MPTAASRKKTATPAKTRPGYGWVPDLPDQRDHTYAAPLAKLGPLPAKADLRRHCPPVYQQGHIGSCTANAIAAALEFDRKKQKLPDFIPSRLFIYYNERVMEKSVPLDNGAQIRDGIKSVHHLGACPEKEWTYDDTKADPKTNLWPAGAKPTQQPPANCYTNAALHLALSYERVSRSLTQMKSCLASGYPFVFGFTVYDSFESDAVAQTGLLDMPAAGEAVIGGHAVLCVGYDDKAQRFTVRNSWGKAWGQKGYFTMPYAYLLDANLSDDMWTIRAVS